MSAEDIIEELKREGEKTLKSINSECQKELKELDDKYTALQKEMRAKSEKVLLDQLGRMEITFKDEIKIGRNNVLLLRKKEIITTYWERVFQLKEKVRTDKRYKDFLNDSVKHAQQILGNKTIIYGSPADKKIVDLIEGEFKFVTDEREDLGIVITSHDKSRNLNMTLSSIIDEQHENIEAELLKGLGAV